MVEKWIEVLQQEVSRSNHKEAGKRIGYSRSAVSLAVKGVYPGGTDNIRRAVMQELAGEIECPHLGELISKDDCSHIQKLPLSTSNMNLRRHRKACAHCQFNTSVKELDHVA